MSRAREAQHRHRMGHLSLGASLTFPLLFPVLYDISRVMAASPAANVCPYGPALAKFQGLSCDLLVAMGLFADVAELTRINTGVTCRGSAEMVNTKEFLCLPQDPQPVSCTKVHAPKGRSLHVGSKDSRIPRPFHQRSRLSRRGVFSFAPSAVSTASCEAVALKLSLTQWTPSPPNSLPWSGDKPCSWTGVTCDASGRVIGLILRSQLSSGILPLFLGQLGYLKQLALSNNSLTGEIPNSFSLLTSLTLLSLRGNKLNGTFPAPILSLKGLRHLNLGSNFFYGTLPEGIHGLTSLRLLYIDNNQFTGAIPRPKALKDRLQSSNINSNFFTALSEEICAARTLRLRKNCFFNITRCAWNQRSREECANFCNTTSPEGPCNGHGTCRIELVSKEPYCQCGDGYSSPKGNPRSCVKDEPVPPKDPKFYEVFVPGIRFDRYPTDGLRNLNRWSRYLSLMYSRPATQGADPVVNYSALFVPPIEYLLWYTGRADWLGGVFDQQACGSCWAVSATDAVTAAVAALNRNATGNIQIQKLAHAQVYTCASNDSSGGCSGDFPANALQYAADAHVQESFSLTADTCADMIKPGSLPPQIMMFEQINIGDPLRLMWVLQVQPAVVMLEGSTLAWMLDGNKCSLTTFVFNDTRCYTGRIDHAVLVVGYEAGDNPTGVPHWIIRNSWNDTWCPANNASANSGGYFRMGMKAGDGVCGMNVLPAYYPIPTPPETNPCYSNLTAVGTTDFERLTPFRPCGGVGQCIPRPEWGALGYECDCSVYNGTFVAVDNINVTVNGSVSRTQACVPANACVEGNSLEVKPCGAGTCVPNSSTGDYTCDCPLGYLHTLQNGKESCSWGPSSLASTPKYKTHQGETCSSIATSFALTLKELQARNPGKCPSASTKLAAFTELNVTHSQCRAFYRVTPNDANANKPCQAVVDRLSIPTWQNPLSEASLSALNPQIDCSATKPLIAGQPLCIDGRARKSPSACPTIALKDVTCKQIMESNFPTDPIVFFEVNEGINCDNLGTGKQAQVCLYNGGQQVTDCTLMYGVLAQAFPINKTNCQWLRVFYPAPLSCQQAWKSNGFVFKSQKEFVNLISHSVAVNPSLACGHISSTARICVRKRKPGMGPRKPCW